ncbi:peptidase C14 [Rhodoferax koreense]|uniref:Peptidase C14 n=1 Tax=Rhodoferax koreensis TaxID=1842727 RepID=A0A1P8K3W1_9BURK|nr:caspase family protein [Rhodoferax koreense]APW40676.1 peptidase C14 [Rhodoferax koreense]
MAHKEEGKSRLAKTTALSLHIGLNAVSPAAYSGWSGELAACEFDANDMAAIARSKGLKPTVLLTKQATRAKMLGAMRSAAKALKAGDFFFMSYSGHGGQVPDVSGDEADKQDETWCLYDGQLIDDELYFELGKFKAGVRILVLSDSCHSGTVVRELPPQFDTLPHQRPKLMPPAVAMRVYREHQAFYDDLQKEVGKAAGKAMIDPDAALANVAVNVATSGRLTTIASAFKPAVVLISGCQDNQTSMDGDHNGAFTEQLLKVWNNGAFTGSYALFQARIKAGLPPTQSPNLFTLGAAAAFLKQTPFTVEPPPEKVKAA